MNRQLGRAAIVALALGATPTTFAHDGVDHAAGEAIPESDTRPHWLSASRLQVSTALQRRLALRSVAAADSAAATQILSAEVLAHPAGNGSIGAPEYGRLEADQAWPLAGQTVRKGQLLAWLKPVLSLQQESERRRDVALLAQQLRIATINRDRLAVQVEASAGVVASNNVYYDEAVLEFESLSRQLEQARGVLDARIALRAPFDGVLGETAVGNGDVVEAGTRVFGVSEARRLRIALNVFDPELVRHPPPLSLPQADGRAIALRAAGSEPLAHRQGWRLLYDGDGDAGAARQPGEIVEVLAEIPDSAAPACLRSQAGAELWVQVEPEIFERRRAADCRQIQISATERWVRDGAAILGQYR